MHTQLYQVATESLKSNDADGVAQVLWILFDFFNAARIMEVHMMDPWSAHGGFTRQILAASWGKPEA